MMLKTRNLLLFVTAVVGLLVLAGCSRSGFEETAPIDQLGAKMQSGDPELDPYNSDSTTTEECTKKNCKNSLTTLTHPQSENEESCDFASLIGTNAAEHTFIPLAGEPHVCILPFLEEVVENEPGDVVYGMPVGSIAAVYRQDSDDPDPENCEFDPTGIVECDNISDPDGPLVDADADPEIFCDETSEDYPGNCNPFLIEAINILSSGSVRGLGSADGVVAIDIAQGSVGTRYYNSGGQLAFGTPSNFTGATGGIFQFGADDFERNGRISFLTQLGVPLVSVREIASSGWPAPNENWDIEITGLVNSGAACDLEVATEDNLQDCLVLDVAVFQEDTNADGIVDVNDEPSDSDRYVCNVPADSAIGDNRFIPQPQPNADGDVCVQVS